MIAFVRFRFRKRKVSYKLNLKTRKLSFDKCYYNKLFFIYKKTSNHKWFFWFTKPTMDT